MSRSPWWYSSLPAEWTESRVSSLATLINGYPFDSSLFDPDEGFPLIRIRDLNGTEAETRYNGPFVASVSVSSRDLLIGMDGDFNVGRWYGDEPALLNQRTCMLRGDDHMIRYLEYALPFPLKQINDLTYATTVKHLSSGQLLHTWIPVPDDVRPIVEFLDRETAQIDSMIDAQQRLVDLLVERRKSVVLGSVMNRDDVSWRGELGRVLTKLDRSVGDDSEVVTAYRDGLVVRRSERRDDGYTFSDLEQGYQGVMAGDLVFHGLDGFAGAVGVARSGGKCSPVYHVCTATAPADNRYLGHVLRTYGHIGLLAAHAWSVRQRSVDYRNWKQLAALPIELPSRLEQLRTVESLETELAGIDRMSERVNASVALLRERRAALITAAVTGRIDSRTGVERLDDILEGVAS